MKTYILVIYLLLFLPVNSFLKGQPIPPEDSLIILDLFEKFDSFLYSFPDSAAYFNELAYKKSLELDFYKGSGTALKHFGVIHQYRGDFDSARYYYSRSEELFLEHNDNFRAAAVSANIASTYYDQGHYEDALDVIASTRSLLADSDSSFISAFLDNLQGSIYHFQGYYRLAAEYKNKVKEFYTRAGDMYRLSDVYRDLALLFQLMDKYDKARDAYLSAISMHRSLDDQVFLSESYINYGNMLVLSEQYDSAKYYLDEGLAMMEEYGFYSLRAFGMECKGLYYLETGDQVKAIELFRASIKLAEENDNPYQQSSSGSNLGSAFFQNGQFSMAETVLRHALQLAIENEFTSLEKDIYRQLYDLYKVLEQPFRALEALEQSDRLKDSLMNEEQARHLAEFEIMYELERNRQKLSQQEANIALLEKDARIQTQKISILVISLGLLLAIAIVVYLVILNRSRRLRTINILKIKEQEHEIELKNRELASYALHLSRKNQLLEDLKKEIEGLKPEKGSSSDYNALKRMVNSSSYIDKDWELFKKHFEEVHPDFFDKLQERFPNLSSNDLRLLALMKLNLNSKEIASILNISPESVKKSRYRLKKKMNIDEELRIQDMVNELS